MSGADLGMRVEPEVKLVPAVAVVVATPAHARPLPLATVPAGASASASASPLHAPERVAEAARLRQPTNGRVDLERFLWIAWSQKVRIALVLHIEPSLRIITLYCVPDVD